MGKFICCIFKSAVFWIVFTVILCLSINVGINIIIAYLISFLIEKFLSSYLYIKYGIIPVLFFYNYFVLRKIVISWMFEWQYPFQSFSIYKQRQSYVTVFKKKVNNFINAIEVVLDVKYKISKKEIEYIEGFFRFFNEEFSVYDKLYNTVSNNANNNNVIKYTMSKCQKQYYFLLKAINRIFMEKNIKNNLLNLKNNLNDFSENNIKMNKFTVNQNFENHKNLMHLKLLLKDCLKIIDKYDEDNYTYLSPAYLYNMLFNDTFASLSLHSLLFKRRVEDFQIEENFTPKGKNHYTLIQNKQNINIINNDNNNNNLLFENSKNGNNTLLFFCLPNGGCYELLPKNKLHFFLKKGFSFLCWNYKGYGYTKGRSNFSNIKSDAIELYDTIMNNPKYNFKKICVMGHSIGGVAACHLAKNRRVDLLISDRNFCDMKRLANNLFCGQLFSCLLKFLFIGNTDNINNFINFSNHENKTNNGIIQVNNINNENPENINRIIIYAPNDLLILNDSTVKSGVSRYIIKNYVIYRDNQNNKIIKNKENFLDIVFDKNDKSRFMDNFIRLIHHYYDKKNKNKNHNNNNNNKNNINNDAILDVKNDKNERLLNEELKQDIDETLFSFFDIFFGICCDNLNYISLNQISSRREIIFIDSFFNNLLIWGVQGRDLKNSNYFDFCSYKGIIRLKEAYDILNKYSLNRNQINASPISVLVNNVSEDLQKIINIIENLDIISNNNNENKKRDKKNKIINNEINTLSEKLITDDEEDEIRTDANIIEIKSNKENDSIINSSFYDKLNDIKGTIKLFKTFAGHNGLLKEDEREQFYQFLLSSGIIN